MSKLFRSIILSLGLLGAVSSLTSCASDEPDFEDKIGTRRTVLVYMVASNNLGYDYNFDKENLDAMQKFAQVSSLNNCNVIVYYVRNSAGFRSKRNVSLLRLTPHGFVTEKEYDMTGYTSAVDPAVMKSVIAEVKDRYPAEEYGLVMWSHSQPWQEGTYRSTPVLRNWGIDSGASISLPPMAQALAPTDGKKWKFIYFDSCFGLNIETTYELRNTAEYIIGSQTEVPGAGMPYITNMGNLTATVFDPIRTAQTTFNFYNALDESQGRWNTMSAVKTDELESVKNAAVKIWQSGATPDADYEPQHLVRGYDNYWLSYDMLDHYTHLKNVSAEDLSAFKKAFSKAVIYSNHTPYFFDLKLTNVNGLGSYIATTGSINKAEQAGYKKLQWWKDVLSKVTYLQ